ncbi:hypothetical protein D3C87_1769160 [compost metagenome]
MLDPQGVVAVADLQRVGVVAPDAVGALDAIADLGRDAGHLVEDVGGGDQDGAGTAVGRRILDQEAGADRP